MKTTEQISKSLYALYLAAHKDSKKCGCYPHFRRIMNMIEAIYEYIFETEIPGRIAPLKPNEMYAHNLLEDPGSEFVDELKNLGLSNILSAEVRYLGLPL